MNPPRLETQTLICIVKWIAVTTYLVFIPFRGYHEKIEERFHKLNQACVKSGLLHLPIVLIRVLHLF